MGNKIENARRRLYELHGNMKELREYIENADSPEEMEKLLEDTIEINEESINDTIEQLQMIEREFTAEMEKYKKEKAFFDEFRKEYQTRAEIIKSNIEKSLTLLGYDHKNKKKVTTKFGKLGFQKNPPSVVITDTEKVPPQYEVIPDPTFDVKEILKDYKSKLKVEEEVDGKKVKRDVDVLDMTEEYGFKIINNKSSLRSRK